MGDQQQIRLMADLRALGVRSGDTLLVHSSLRSLGHVMGGAEAVINALQSALGEQGTLLMPALSWEFVKAGQPMFSRRWTGTCVGVIPETFRCTSGTVRSVHPTHSICARGRLADELTAEHGLDRTPVGSNSPLSRLAEAGGKILMLGCGLLPNTSMHGVEERVEPPYLFRPGTTKYVICEGGREEVVEHRRHDFHGYAQRYDRVANVLGDHLCCGKVLEADCFLMDAARLWRAGEDALRTDPFYFVETRGD